MTADLVDDLRQLITARRYAPGERLPSERELAEHFDVARPTIRRAVATLVEHGVVEARGRSGLYFRGTDPRELFAVRLLLEPWAAAEAATRAGETARARIRDLVEQAATVVDDAAAFAAVDAALHEAIMEAAGNVVLLGVHHGLRQRVAWSRGTTGTRAGVRRRSLATLQMLAAAVGARDGAAAGAAMEQHLSEVLAAAEALAEGAVGPS